MKAKDLFRNQRVAGLIKLTEALAKTVKPSEALQAIGEAMQSAQGPNTFIGISTRGLPLRHYRIVQLRIAGVPVDGFDSWETGKSPIRSYEPLAEIISNPSAQFVCELDWSKDPDLKSLLGEYHSVMVAPMGSGKLPIDWAMVFIKGEQESGEAEFEEFILRTTLVAALLDSRTLAQELAAAHAHIDREFKQAGALQRSLLPDPLPNIPGIDIAATYETSTRSGGDIYDIFPDAHLVDETPEQWCIFVGDATGHGAAATVVIAMIQAIIRALPSQRLNVSQRMAFVNSQLCERGLKSAFATAFLATYNVRNNILTYVSAGHPLPLLWSHGEANPRELTGKANLLLGADPGAEYSESTHCFRPGQMLLIYTDGISESRAPDGSFLETSGLFPAFTNPPCSANQLVSRIKQLVANHQQGIASIDDQTAIVIAVPTNEGE